VDAILEEWYISISKVKEVVTDNGSDMVTTFHTYLAVWWLRWWLRKWWL